MAQPPHENEKEKQLDLAVLDFLYHQSICANLAVCGPHFGLASRSQTWQTQLITQVTDVPSTFTAGKLVSYLIERLRAQLNTDEAPLAFRQRRALCKLINQLISYFHQTVRQPDKVGASISQGLFQRLPWFLVPDGLLSYYNGTPFPTYSAENTDGQLPGSYLEMAFVTFLKVSEHSCNLHRDTLDGAKDGTVEPQWYTLLLTFQTQIAIDYAQRTSCTMQESVDKAFSVNTMEHPVLWDSSAAYKDYTRLVQFRKQELVRMVDETTTVDWEQVMARYPIWDMLAMMVSFINATSETITLPLFQQYYEQATGSDPDKTLAIAPLFNTLEHMMVNLPK
ncbi:hypothetical protein IWQ62_001035 [Dispira parvispora]|uniref:Uncharacterized protein n=1 Tax=Dispira parvispora TaxID=1520584 RepID=A0A9W8E8M1_9FUNG|nr:hypothetical protein IWQ62_001035 [Dispira parvispora]